MNNIKQALESAIELLDNFITTYSKNNEDSQILTNAKSALAELEKCEPVAYHEVVNALVGMCDQYLTMPDGHLDHMFMSGGENALEVLEKLELITGEFGEIIPEALDENWIKNKFDLKQLNTKG